MEEPNIEVTHARVHNLRNVDVTIPRGTLTVITGLSGSGKSSLAFDTIYAEGQRRYIETLSAYARQFMGSVERPDVEKISGLSPVIAIEQKTTSKNPRSTVGTTTEIYDFLRLLYARASIAYSKETGEPMVRYTDQQIANLIIEKYEGRRMLLMAPLVKGRKGHYKELFDSLARKGFLTVRVDGEVREIKPFMKLDRYKIHFIELVIDKIVPTRDDDDKRLLASIDTAMKHGEGIIMLMDAQTQELRYFSRLLMCPSTGISYNEPAPHTFSFNSPQGACPRCNGLGKVNAVDASILIPNPKNSISSGGIAPLGKERDALIFAQIEALGKRYGFTLSDPIEKIPDDGLEAVLHGTQEGFRVDGTSWGIPTQYFLSFEGVIAYLAAHADDDDIAADGQYSTQQCPLCKGRRLKEESLYFRFADKNISELADMSIADLAVWFENVMPLLSKRQQAIAAEIVKEIGMRLSFLLEVGLGYLSLSRGSATLSGGESQRIRLATQIGSKLVNVLYILDEPSIGLHQRDNMRLINSLQSLRDAGNTVIVVEHDEETIRAADYLVDVGPGAGAHGGRIVFEGSRMVLDKCIAAMRSGGDASSPSHAAAYSVNAKTYSSRQLPCSSALENYSKVSVNNSNDGLNKSELLVNNSDDELNNSEHGLKNSDAAVNLFNDAVINSNGSVNNSVVGAKNTNDGVNNIKVGVKNSEDGVNNSNDGLKNSNDGVNNTKVGVKNSNDELKNSNGVLKNSEGGLKNEESLTLKYLAGVRRIEAPAMLRAGSGECLTLKGASGNNLHNLTLTLPLGKFICITGVSGSGKSSLINQTLQPILSQRFYRSLKNPLPYESIEGIEFIDKVIEVNQSPIGRTPRSNPATYTGVMGDIRKLYENTPDAKARGFKAGRFSFNVKGGRCEECRGAGVQTIEMNFMPNVYVKCRACNGKRYNHETLCVRYKGKNINDILEMTIEQAADFFEHQPSIHRYLRALADVGLGYVKLGQPSTTLSGGESQRVKLATELAKQATGSTLYIFDEPTTGLHFEDVRMFLMVLHKLADKGNTIVVIEHNLDVIRSADHIIDLGPEGGSGGGEILCEGTPSQIAACPRSHTGRYLKGMM
jgi:excinuclease UvrABC ATPase subunit